MSSFQNLGPILSTTAGVTFATYGVAINLDASGNGVLPSAGGPIVGITTDTVVAGQALAYQHTDIAEWRCGGTVSKGDHVKSDAAGLCVTASAADILAGSAVGRCHLGAASGQMAAIQLMITGAGTSGGGVLDTALDTAALDAAMLYDVVYFSVDGTKTAALPAGIRAGQVLRLQCDLATTTPDGSVTGTFLTQAGAAGTSLAFDAAADEAVLVWTGAAWRVLTLTSVTLT